MSGKIIALLGGGIGNRLPPLLSSMRLAHLYDRELYVFWSTQEEFHLTLGDLFDESNLPFSTDVPPLGSHRLFPYFNAEGLLEKPARVEELPPETTMVIGGFPFTAHHADERAMNPEARDPFMAEMQKHFELLTLNKLLVSRTNSFTEKHDFSHVLGVHIRRTAIDSVYTPIDQGRNVWKVEWYAEAIEQLLKAYSNLTQIYIATNSSEVRHFMRSSFGEMVISNEEAGDGWSSLHNQREALVDLLVLSRCAAILRQPGTTFSTLASVLSCAPLLTLCWPEAGETNPGLDWSFLGNRRL